MLGLSLRRQFSSTATGFRLFSNSTVSLAAKAKAPTSKAEMSKDDAIRTISEAAVKADSHNSTPAELAAATTKAVNEELVHGENDASRSSKIARAGEKTLDDVEMREQCEGTKAARGVAS